MDTRLGLGTWVPRGSRFGNGKVQEDWRCLPAQACPPSLPLSMQQETLRAERLWRLEDEADIGYRQ